eukprot:10551047-Heterocapsa_arctica.AAC.1
MHHANEHLHIRYGPRFACITIVAHQDTAAHCSRPHLIFQSTPFLGGRTALAYCRQELLEAGCANPQGSTVQLNHLGPWVPHARQLVDEVGGCWPDW